MKTEENLEFRKLKRSDLSKVHIDKEDISDTLRKEIVLFIKSFFNQNTPEEHLDYVVGKDTLALFRNKHNNQIVGLTGVSIKKIVLKGKSRIIIHPSGTFLKKEAYGLGLISSESLASIVRGFKKYPFTKQLVVMECVTPAGYLHMARRYPQTYPNYKKIYYPNVIKGFLKWYIESRSDIGVFDWSDQVLIGKPWQDRIKQDVMNYTYLEDEHLSFFLQRNPDYLKGSCLIIVVPISLLNLISLAGYQINKKINLFMRKILGDQST